MAPVRFPRLQDDRWLRHAYVVKRRSTTDIALELGCTAAAVSAALKRHGIPARPRNAPHGIGYRRRMRVKRAIRAKKSIDRQFELRAHRQLIPHVKVVLEAYKLGDAMVLRAALIDLGALCQLWAERIPQTREQVTLERARR